MIQTQKKALITMEQPEFDKATGLRFCNAPGCRAHGEFKAPKSRDELREYYWFCLDHVRAYNSAWDYFKGMSQAEIEQHMYNTMIWDRPTWNPSFAHNIDIRLRQRIYERFVDGDDAFVNFKFSAGADKASSDLPPAPNPEMEALLVMGLQPPTDWEAIRERYKALAKKYHPDLTGNDREAEELLKKVNLAYSVLKLAHQKYTELDKR